MRDDLRRGLRLLLVAMLLRRVVPRDAMLLLRLLAVIFVPRPTFHFF